ncbi:phosphotransferase [Candidatus Woesearchaeota archaeon]|jgi:aminoglycoside phosphotransferase (APT) family kinase protein|nr:phosphotransferase [Candidatus Woesearchaeota archaeon]MBT6518739.1 phosphotransferase [Candidatus Woesearchaeota archaeon]MBT7367910.1 phosphotransferase [Candidatus Woesearchaeota archaeon]
MDNSIIKQIFSNHNLEEPRSIKKIEIGFTNQIYSINDKFILKICGNLDNEENFKKEVFFYDFFKNEIPVPDVIVFDESKKMYDQIFMIYYKIQGDTLYSKWHLMADIERKKVIKQLCNILKKINTFSYEEFTTKFKIKQTYNWHDKIINKIQNSLKQIEEKKLLSTNFIQTIKKFVTNNHQVLVDQKLALVYWDAHFDNILVQNNQLVGILDFERTELASVDFSLDIIKRMVEYPKKYMSEEQEKFAKKEDYEHLLDWFREFYPELFNFENLDKRLDMYAVEHDLKTLLEWPNSKEVKQMIAKTVKYNCLEF